MTAQADRARVLLERQGRRNSAPAHMLRESLERAASFGADSLLIAWWNLTQSDRQALGGQAEWRRLKALAQRKV